MTNTPADSEFDAPIITTKKIRVYGLFSFIATTRHIFAGIADDIDAIFATAVQIDKSSQIEYNGQKFEITEEITAETYRIKSPYAYALKRVENTPV